MKRIGILSDTHSFLHPKVFEFLRDVDEIWHAGDIGNLQTLEALRMFKPLRAVYGNIDGSEIRRQCPHSLLFLTEKVRVLMIHIGGYPGRYTPEAKALIAVENPDLFVCGHSHILKIMYDPDNRLLHINPGAAGHYGLHRSVTMVRLVIDNNTPKDVEVFDLPRSERGEG
jgi:putative phosphoesterase